MISPAHIVIPPQIGAGRSRIGNETRITSASTEAAAAETRRMVRWWGVLHAGRSALGLVATRTSCGLSDEASADRTQARSAHKTGVPKRDQGFESFSIQWRVGEPSVPQRGTFTPVFEEAPAHRNGGVRDSLEEPERRPKPEGPTSAPPVDFRHLSLPGNQASNRRRRETAHVGGRADCALAGIEIGPDCIEGGVFHDHDHYGSGEHRRQDRVLEPVRKMLRMGQRRLFSQTTVAVANGPESFAGKAPNFGGTPLLGATALKAVLDGLATRGVPASPLFGVPRTTPLPAAGGSAVSFIRALASETQPRRGPRLPTMMRFDSLLVTGTNAVANTPLNWNAVLTGARLTNEARSIRPDLGNPGNRAGPDILATGVRYDGWLARDLALHAIKRAQPIVPLGGSTVGWVVETGGNNWNPPPADTTGTVAGVMLETVAAICDTPELSVGLVPEPQQGDNVQALVNAATNALGLPNVPVNGCRPGSSF